MTTDIDIRPVETSEDYHAVEQIQRDAWGIDNAIVVPLNILAATHKNGGVVLGAFDTSAGMQQERMVGFVFGFVGLLPGGRVKHCSHMAGVLPAYQNQDIGYRLKCAQREHVLAQQLNVITWTFDPLESRNGYFNLHKLGTIARTYMRNVYGTDPFDVAGIGLPSDRFEVEWHIASSRVLRRLDEPLPPLTPDVVRGMGVPHLNPLDDRDGGFDFRQHAMRERSPVLVEIPLDFRAIRSSDSELARQWRQATRTMFETAFAAGYAATNMVLDSSDKRCWYFLEQWDEEA